MKITIESYQLEDMLQILLSNGYVVKVSGDGEYVTLEIISKKIEIKEGEE